MLLTTPSKFDILYLCCIQYFTHSEYMKSPACATWSSIRPNLTFRWRRKEYDYCRKSLVIDQDMQHPSTTLRISRNTLQSLCVSSTRCLRRPPKRNSKIPIHENPGLETLSTDLVGPSRLLVQANRLMSNMYSQRIESRNQMQGPP